MKPPLARFASLLLISLALTLFLPTGAAAAGPGVETKLLRITFLGWNDPFWHQLIETEIRGIDDFPIQIESITSSITPVDGHGTDRLFDGSYVRNDEFALRGTREPVVLTIDLGQVRIVKSLRVINDGQYGALGLRVDKSLSLDGPWEFVGRFTNMKAEFGIIGDNMLEFFSVCRINEINTATGSWIELFNPGRMDFSLKDHLLETDGSSFAPGEVFIPGNGYLILAEGFGSEPGKTFTGMHFGWTDGTGGFCSISGPGGIGIDFVRWGDSSRQPPQGTAFSGPAIKAPVRGTTLGRNEVSDDTGTSPDFWTTFPTPEAENILLLEISGLIIDSKAAPLSGVTVRVDGVPVASTDASGLFTIAGLRKGPCLISATKRGYLFSPTEKRLELTSHAGGINFLALPDPGSYLIAGYLLGPNGQGIGRAPVIELGSGQTVETNFDGYFSFPGKSRGSYGLTVNLAGYVVEPAAMLVEVVTDRTDIVFRATPETDEYQVTGRITNGYSVPMEGIRVWAGDMVGVSDQDGYYTIEHVRGTGIEVQPELEGNIFFPSTREASPPGPVVANFTVSTTDRSAVRCKVVTLTGQPFKDIDVRFESLFLTQIKTSKSDGFAFFHSLPTGLYEVQPINQGYSYIPSSMTLDLRNENTQIQFVATPITVSYTIEGMISTEAGKPLMGAMVSLMRGSSEIAKTFTDSEGFYEFPIAPAGALSLVPTLKNHSIHPPVMGIGLSSDLHGLDFIATPRTDFRIKGQVLDEFGLPVKGVKIKSVSEDGSNTSTAITDASGFCELGPYPAGVRRLEAGLEGHLIWPFRIDAEAGESDGTIQFTARYEIFHPVTYTGKSFRIKATGFGNSRYLQMNEVTFFGNVPGRSTVSVLPAAGVLCGTPTVPGYDPERLIDGLTSYNSDFAVIHGGSPVLIDIDLAGEFVVDRIVVTNDGEFGATGVEVWTRNGPSGEWAFLARGQDLAVESGKMRSSQILLTRGNLRISEVSDLDGGFVELHNHGMTRVGIKGFKIRTGGVDRTLPEITMAPSETIALWSGTSVSGPGILPLGVSPGFSPEGDFVCLYDTSGKPVDFVRWGSCWELPPAGTEFNGANPPVPSADSSLSRLNPETDADEGSDWGLLPNSPGRTAPFEIALAGSVVGPSGTPIGGVEVTATTAGGMVRVATTDSAGSFVIQGLPPARLNIVPSGAGYAFHPPFLPGLFLSDTGDLTFTGAPPPPGARVEGLVADPAGIPIPGVTISAPGIGTAVTGISGRWVLPVAYPGTYKLEPWSAGRSFSPTNQVSTFDERMIQTGASVRADFTGQTIELPVRARGKVTTGVVPLPGVRVYLSSNGAFAETGTDGWYEISLPQGGGPHVLTPGKGGYRFDPPEHSFYASAPVNGVDFTALPAYSIGGRALDKQGAGIPGATVAFSDGVTVETTSLGSFFRDGMAAGAGWMTITKAGYLFDGPTRNFALPPSIVSVEFSGHRPDQTFILGGLITYSNGDPVRGVMVDILNDAGNRAASVATGTDGTFAISGLPAGTYGAVPSSGNHRFDPPSASHALSSDYRALVFSATRLYSISGQVRLGGGSVLPGATLTLSPGGSSARTGQNGSYSFTRLEPGTYTISASMEGYGFEPQIRTVALTADSGGQDFTASLSGSGLVLWVDSKSGSDSNAGTEAKPFKSLGWAISVARQGDTISLAPGTYQGGVALPFGVSLRGSGAGVTFLDGQGRSFVLQTSAQSRVSGLTITNGGLAPASRGILCGTDTVVSNCLVTGCGEGVTITASAPEFTNLTVWGNSAAGVKVVKANGALFDSCVLQGFSVAGSPEMSIANSLVFDGSAANWWGGGVISGDPGFTDFPAPSTPDVGSRCIDAGNPSTGSNDPDGSRNDMGYTGGPGRILGRIPISPLRGFSDIPSLEGFPPLAAADGDDTLSGGFAAAISGPQGSASSCRLDFELPGLVPLRAIRVLCPVSVGADTILVYSGPARNSMILGGSASFRGETAGQLEYVFESQTMEGRFIGLVLMNFRDPYTVMVNEVSIAGTALSSPETLRYTVSGDFTPWPGYGFQALSDSSMTYNGDFAALHGGGPMAMELDLGNQAEISALAIWNDGSYGAGSVQVQSGQPGSWTGAVSFPLVAVGAGPVENQLNLNGVNSRYLRLEFSDFGDDRWFQLNEISVAGAIEGITRVSIVSASSDPSSFPGYGASRLLDGTYTWNDDFAVKNSAAAVSVVLDLGADRALSRIVHFNDGEFGALEVKVWVSSSSDPETFVEAGLFTGLGSSPGRVNQDILDFPAVTGRRVKLEYSVFSNSTWFQLNEIEAYLVSQAAPGGNASATADRAETVVRRESAYCGEIQSGVSIASRPRRWGFEGSIRVFPGMRGENAASPFPSLPANRPTVPGSAGEASRWVQVGESEFSAAPDHLLLASMGALIELVPLRKPNPADATNSQEYWGTFRYDLPGAGFDCIIDPAMGGFGDAWRFCANPWMEPMVPVLFLCRGDSKVAASGWLVLRGAVIAFIQPGSVAFENGGTARPLGELLHLRSGPWPAAADMAVAALEAIDMCGPPPLDDCRSPLLPDREVFMSIATDRVADESVFREETIAIAGQMVSRPNLFHMTDPFGCISFVRRAGALLRRIQPDPETFR